MKKGRKNYDEQIVEQVTNCRMFIEKPMCFNSFINLIFSNFYPECKIYLDPNDYITFEINDDYEYGEGLTKIVC